MVRFADDAVMGFRYEWEARALLAALENRLKEHKLELHPEKTRLIEFGRFAKSNRKKRGEGNLKPSTFSVSHIAVEEPENESSRSYEKR